MMSYFDPNKALYNEPIIYPNTELHQFMLYLKENPSLSDFYVTSDIFTKIVTMSNLDDALLILETTPYDIIKKEAVPDAPPPLPHEIYHGSFYNIDTRLHSIPPEHVQFFVDKLKIDLVEGFDYSLLIVFDGFLKHLFAFGIGIRLHLHPRFAIADGRNSDDIEVGVVSFTLPSAYNGLVS